MSLTPGHDVMTIVHTHVFSGDFAFWQHQGLFVEGKGFIVGMVLTDIKE